MWKRMMTAVAVVVMLSTITFAEPSAALQEIRLVALGDSYTSGNGATSYDDKVCYRSAYAYLKQYANAVRSFAAPARSNAA